MQSLTLHRHLSREGLSPPGLGEPNTLEPPSPGLGAPHVQGLGLFLFSSYSCQLLLFQDNTILIGFCLQNCSLSPHRCPQTGLLPRRRGAGSLGRKAWRLLGEKVKEMLLLPLSPCPLLLLFILCYFSCLVQNHNYKKQKHLFFFYEQPTPHHTIGKESCRVPGSGGRKCPHGHPSSTALRVDPAVRVEPIGGVLGGSLLL